MRFVGSHWFGLLCLVCATFVVLPSSAIADSEAPIDFMSSLGHKDLIDPTGKGIKTRALFNKEALPVEKASVPGPEKPSVPGPVVDREVIGYLPYWEMDYEFKHWEYLTILAWFAVDMNSKGDATDYHGWGGASTEALVEEAHANGVKVIVTITNFNDDEIGTLLKSPTSRQNAIDTCLELMAIHQVDGINIDFEFVPASAKEEFVTFMGDLKDAVAAVQPNGHEGHVSLAGPSVDWKGAYDYDQLLIHSDGIMVMAYGYHWSGGDPGPVAPLYGGGKWPEGKNSVSWTIDDYLKWGGEENRHRIYIGLPWYGREWTVANAAVPGQSLGKSSAVVFTTAKKQAAQQGKQYDTDSETAYYHINHDDELWQVWFDDRTSFDAKVAYVVEKDLGGIGIWALGYDGGDDDMWDGIANNMVSDNPEPGPDPEPGPEPEPEPDPELSGDDVMQSDVFEPEVVDNEVIESSDAGVDVSTNDGASRTPPRANQPSEHVQLTTVQTTNGGCGLGPQPPSPHWIVLTILCLLLFNRRRSLLP